MCGKVGHAWQGGWGVHGKGACLAAGVHARGHAWHGGCAWQGGSIRAGEMATEAGGTHPIGMHSCLVYSLIFKKMSH